MVKIQSADFIIEAGALKEYHGAGTDVVIPDNVYEHKWSISEDVHYYDYLT